MNHVVKALFFLALATSALAQEPVSKSQGTSDIAPVISKLTISPDTVTDLRLKPFYAASIRMPEAVSSVVVGAPTLFLAEHNEREPNLVVVKPITTKPAYSNLLIATKSGLVVSLRLDSDGIALGGSKPVDFVLIYSRRGSFLIGASDETPAPPPASGPVTLMPYERALHEQALTASPAWKNGAGAIAASMGAVTGNGDDMIIAFSVMNSSGHWIELLPPQVELANPNSNKGGSGSHDRKEKKVLADQVAIKEFRFTQQKLAPGARADGVVRFERPDFKQRQEHLQMVLATADAVNRPILLDVPFTAPPITGTLNSGK